jgi:hypothetical protein
VSDDPRPWWASDGDATTTEPIDPVEAHRAARRGNPGDRDRDPAAWWDLPPVDEQSPADEPPPADQRTADDPPPATHGPDVCGVCPICHVLRSLGESRPQLVEHLTEAARHLAAAVRDVLEDPPRPRGPRGGSGGGHDEGPRDLERIDLD